MSKGQCSVWKLQDLPRKAAALRSTGWGNSRKEGEDQGLSSWHAGKGMRVCDPLDW